MRIFCGRAQCGEELGEVGASLSGLNPNPVWRIAPGWAFRQGVLERADVQFYHERRLNHEVFGRVPEGASVRREVNLPVVVRCPKCHGLRFVTPDVVLRPLVGR